MGKWDMGKWDMGKLESFFHDTPSKWTCFEAELISLLFALQDGFEIQPLKYCGRY